MYGTFKENYNLKVSFFHPSDDIFYKKLFLESMLISKKKRHEENNGL